MNRHLTKCSISLLLLVGSLFGVKAQTQETNIPKTGKLANGLTYYVIHSDLQPGLVSFYLVQKAGAILENDNQNGLAHVLEHMAFEGSKHFPDGVDSYLKSQNITDFDAATGIHETVYNLDNVNNKPFLVDTCMYVMRDWCHGLLLRDKDIARVRGVISEEWRMRKDVYKRYDLAMRPYLYNYSKYATHDPIGDINIIQHFKRKTLIDFYHKWYRPDLQCVIIVGDIDAAEVEAKVKTIFGDIPPVKNAAKIPTFGIPDTSAIYYTQFKDKELQSNDIEIYAREHVIKPKHQSEVDRRQQDYMLAVFNYLSAKRIEEYKNANDEQFFDANISYNEREKNYNETNINVQAFPNKDKEALQEILGIWQQIKRFGFTDDEVEQHKKDKLEILNHSLTNLKLFGNTVYVNKFKNCFLDSVPYLGLKAEVDTAIVAIHNINAEKLNAWVRHLDLEKNMTIACTGNDTTTTLLSKDEVLATIKQMDTTTVEPVVLSTDSVLIDFKIPEGKIISEDSLPRFGAKIWYLSNGAKVIYKQVTEERNKVFYKASSWGGTSILKASQLPSVSALGSLALKSGIYKYDLNTLLRILSGKNVHGSISIDEIRDRLDGSSSSKNAELLFQLMYLIVTHPRYEKKDFDEMVQQLYKQASLPKAPLDLVRDSINDLEHIKSDRIWKFDKKLVNAMDFETMKRLLPESFSNSKSFTYYIVGDIDSTMAKEMASKYIASLPSTDAPQKNFVDYDLMSTEPIIQKKYVIDMPDNKAIVSTSYFNHLALSDKEKLEIYILTNTLSNRYFKTVREASGGSYDVNVSPDYSDFPHNFQQLSISFSTEKGKEDKLRKIIFNELDSVKTIGISQAEVKEAVGMMKKDREQDLLHKTSAYWIDALQTYQERKIDVTDPKYFENIIDTITPEDVLAFTKRFFKNALWHDFVIVSKDEPQPTAAKK